MGRRGDDGDVYGLFFKDKAKVGDDVMVMCNKCSPMRASNDFHTVSVVCVRRPGRERSLRSCPCY